MNRKAGRTAALETLGCRVNIYDTEAMKELLRKDGYEIVPFNEKADVYIINTCTVTRMGDRKSRQMAGRARRLNDDAVIAMVGCYSQVATEEIENLTDVDIILGSRNKRQICSAIEKFLATGERVVEVSDIMFRAEFEPLDISEYHDHSRAFIKIQDGCDRFCTYCMIPYARGGTASKDKDLVLSEIRDLKNHGFKEIILSGIHIASYGRDLDGNGRYLTDPVESDDDGINKNEDILIVKNGITTQISSEIQHMNGQGNEYGLLELLEDIETMEDIERVRIGSIEPAFFSGDRIDRIASLKRLCPHFHLSLQSGSDTVLRRMNRRYTTKEYEETVEALREKIPGVSITTDVIVGFPGETVEEYEQTRNLLERISLTKVHVFRYSPRKGTPAASMSGQISQEVKEERSRILMEQSDRKEMEFLDAMKGIKVKVLTEVHPESSLIGYTENYSPICPEAPSQWKTQPRGQIIEMEVTGRRGSMLTGILIPEDRKKDKDY